MKNSSSLSRTTSPDFVVVGAGIAGLRAAVALAEAGTVLVLAKREVTESNTQYAQGGIAAALSDEDEVGLHLQDTLDAGDGLVNEAAARVLVEEGPERIEELIHWGTEFDRDGTRLSFTREGAHSRNRILHAQGDSTGRELQRALYAKARTVPNITVSEFEFSTELLLDSGRAAGVAVLADGSVQHIHTSAVLLATGGLGQLYRDTTNPEVATGDGVAMAFRAGAELSDLEFIQFHPTALCLESAPHFLLSEALRGEGAYLRNDQKHRFMPDQHPLAELAPRDVVARAITHELAISKAAAPVVYLDLTHLDAEHVKRRFPRIYSTCLQYKIDITHDLIPIRPAAHYAMGGVRTDLDGATSVRGLYAAGEAACTGVHGANRLASNSLLEGLVFGARAGNAMRGDLRTATSLHGLAVQRGSVTRPDDHQKLAVAQTLRQIQELMWQEVGIVRNGEGLQRAILELEEIAPTLDEISWRRGLEARNVLDAGMLVAQSALAREESRGAHYRTDFPTRDDEHYQKHSVVTPGAPVAGDIFEDPTIGFEP